MIVPRYGAHLTPGVRPKSAPKTLPMSEAMLPMNGCKLLTTLGCSAPTDRSGRTLRMSEATLPMGTA